MRDDSLKYMLDKMLDDFTHEDYLNIKLLAECENAMQLHIKAAALGIKKFNQNCSFALVLLFASHHKKWIVDYVKNTDKKDSILTIRKGFAANVMALHQSMVKTDGGREAFYILFDTAIYGYWIHML